MVKPVANLIGLLAIVIGMSVDHFIGCAACVLWESELLISFGLLSVGYQKVGCSLD